MSLRGLAAAAVCFYHFVCTTTGFVRSQSILNIFHFGQYGVSLFFIISGIVIPIAMINSGYRIQKWHQFMIRRFVRIEPPYLVAVGIGITYLVVRNYIPGSAPIDLTPDFTNVILHLGYLVPFFENQTWINPVFWTLAIEFQYYLFISLLFPLILSKKFPLRILFYGSMIALSFLNSNTSFFPHWSVYFLIGITYALFFTKQISLIEYLSVSVVSIVVTIYELNVVNAAIAIAAICVIHFAKNLRFQMGDFVGNISYSLYLLHSIVGSAFVNFFSHRVSESWEKVVVILCGFLISLFSAYIMYRLVELPSQKAARKLFL